MQSRIKNITVRGARQHNLKNINVEIPRNRLTVITGLSGSGKSSLAFDTIYAEGQRRYVESLSAYARQFLDRLEPPDVDSIEGLSPAISIEQKTASRSPRSTVGTVTEIYDYLRLLFSSVGIPHCYQCGKAISKQTPDQIVRHLKALPEGARVMVLAPIVRGRKGEFKKQLEGLAKKGYGRGMKYDYDPARIVSDPTRPLLNGALGLADGWCDEEFESQMRKIADLFGADLSLPFGQLPLKTQSAFFYGIKERGKRVEGIID